MKTKNHSPDLNIQDKCSQESRSETPIKKQNPVSTLSDKIHEKIDEAKDFIERNKGHCSSCVQYCNEKQGEIDAFEMVIQLNKDFIQKIDDLKDNEGLIHINRIKNIAGDDLLK